MWEARLCKLYLMSVVVVWQLIVWSRLTVVVVGASARTFRLFGGSSPR